MQAKYRRIRISAYGFYVGSPKKTDVILVRLPPEMGDNVRIIAEFKGWETPELIRRALRGVIETFREEHTVPDHMRMVPAVVKPPALLAAEVEQAAYDATQKRPPDKSSRSRGGGPAHRVPKSAA